MTFFLVKLKHIFSKSRKTWQCSSLEKKVSGNVNDFCKEARGEIEVAAFGKYYSYCITGYFFTFFSVYSI